MHTRNDSTSSPSPGNWAAIARGGLLSGTLSMVVLMLAGRRELGASPAALNAPSQWVWGKEALAQDGWTWRHTGIGTTIHQASACFWAALMFKGVPRAVAERPVATAVLTTATAAFVDLALTPPRLTPGFEKRLSPRSLALTYGMFALGLAWAARRHAAAHRMGPGRASLAARRAKRDPTPVTTS